MGKDLLLVVSALVLLSACTSLKPVRTHTQTEPNDIKCTPSPEGVVSSDCAHQIVEISEEGYRLYFAEFDDQGRPYSNTAENGQAHAQIKTFIDGVKKAVDDRNGDGVSVVVFAHGWLHSAQTDDDNLKAFRRLLTELNLVEDAAGCHRQVVGLYIGWRGAGTKLHQHPLDTPTFWSRKLAAEQIATGSFLQIPAKLRALQRDNTPKVKVSRTKQGSYCGSRLKTTYVGHSFGGLIMMSSMSQHLIGELVLLGQAERDRQPKRCDSDAEPNPTATLDELVIAINPAIEGARFDALFRVASDPGLGITCYHAPKFLAITSKADWATDLMFPLGRTLNTITKRYPKGDKLGRTAARVAVGHDEQYITRELTFIAENQLPEKPNTSICKEYPDAKLLSDKVKYEVDQASKLYRLSNGGYDSNTDQEASWPRVFCSSWILKLDKKKTIYPRGALSMSDDKSEKNFNRNVPIWNVSTEAPVIYSHGDIRNPLLLDFLRQIYIDTMFFR